MGLNVADLAATSHAPTAAQIAKYQNLQAYFMGGRAVVIIAHSGAVTSSNATNSEMLYLYNNYSSAMTSMRMGLT